MSIKSRVVKLEQKSLVNNGGCGLVVVHPGQVRKERVREVFGDRKPEPGEVRLMIDLSAA